MREVLRWGMGVGFALLLGVGVGALTGSDVFGVLAFGLVMSVFLMVAVLAYPPREIGSGHSGGAADGVTHAGGAGGAGPGVEDGRGGGFDGGGGFGGGGDGGGGG